MRAIAWREHALKQLEHEAKRGPEAEAHDEVGEPGLGDVMRRQEGGEGGGDVDGHPTNISCMRL